MANAKREAIAINEGSSDVTVALDGSWQKRGHPSLHGVVTATSLDSGKVLDIECLTKYCPKCKNQQNVNHPDSLLSYQGSSGGMKVVV